MAQLANIELPEADLWDAAENLRANFERSMSDILVELADLNQESVALAKTIQRNFEGFGI